MSGLLGARAGRGLSGSRRRVLNDKQVADIRRMWAEDRQTKAEIGALFRVSKSTVDRIVRPERLGPPRPVPQMVVRVKVNTGVDSE